MKVVPCLISTYIISQIRIRGASLEEKMQVMGMPIECGDKTKEKSIMTSKMKFRKFQVEVWCILRVIDSRYLCPRALEISPLSVWLSISDIEISKRLGSSDGSGSIRQEKHGRVGSVKRWIWVKWNWDNLQTAAWRACMWLKERKGVRKALRNFIIVYGE